MTASTAYVRKPSATIAAADVDLTAAVVEAWLCGASWRTIGVLLGTSRQAAAKRFGAALHQALEISGDSMNPRHRPCGGASSERRRR